MKKVTIYSNWCYVDVLGDDYKDVLRDGEELRVQWNDGSITNEKILVESRVDHYHGHGGGDDITTSKAYIQIKYKGNSALIRLVDSDLLCERINPPMVPKSGGLVTRGKRTAR